MKYLAFLILIFTSFWSSANVIYIPGEKSGNSVKPPTFIIDGVISKEDIHQFKNNIPTAMGSSERLGLNKLNLVRLNSLGGDLGAAVSIGIMIKDINAIVRVDDGASCASSCVFLLAAGSRRTVNGRVGIHRPYLVNDKESTPAGQKAAYKRLEIDLKKYLENMNIKQDIYDDMLKVPPNQIKWLSNKDMLSYGLNSDDPYYDEALNTQIANRLGISKQEYLQAISESEQTCIKSKSVDCLSDILTRKKIK